MQIPPSFEIRMALIGYVSVGKTTVLNAFFGAKYGEVAMKRTTAVVNHFRTSTPDQANLPEGEGEEKGDTVPSESPQQWANAVDNPKSAAVTLKETQRDNAKHRNSKKVHEKTYDIVLDEDWHPMRKDTKFVVVDIPGINEAGTSSKYKDYVNENWHTFDIAVIVMDGRQGVNTDEQVNLIQLAKANVDSIKNIPVILLLNKIDDPRDDDQKVLIQELRTTAQEIFRLKSPVLAFEEKTTLPSPVPWNPFKNVPSPFPPSSEVEDEDTPFFCIGVKTTSRQTRKVNRRRKFNASPPSKLSSSDSPFSFDGDPTVIPVSATNAFLYRCGAKLTFEKFCKLDRDFLDKLGKESYGRQWYHFSEEEQLEKAFEAVHNEEQRRDGLAISNFDEFLDTITLCIGDSEKQASILRDQVEVYSSRLKDPPLDCDLGAEFGRLYDMTTILDGDQHLLSRSFWSGFSHMTKSAFDSLSMDPSVLANLPKQLRSYGEQVCRLGLQGEVQELIGRTKKIVWDYGSWLLEVKPSEEPFDQQVRLGCALLLSYNRIFCENFGGLKIALEMEYNRMEYNRDRTKNAQNLAARNVWLKLEHFKCDSCSKSSLVYHSQLGVMKCGDCQKRWTREKTYHMCKDGQNRDAQEDSSTGNFVCRLCNRTWLNPEGDSLFPSIPQFSLIGRQHFRDLDDPQHHGYLIKECCSVLEDALRAAKNFQ